MAQATHTTDAADFCDAHFWRHAILAGLIGGAVFMMAEMLMVMLIGESPWAPPHMIAAMGLGADVLPGPENPPTFDVGIMMMAMMIHFPLAMLYGLLAGWIIQSTKIRSFIGKLAVGAGIGLAIYVVNFYLIASFVFEWFAMARNWVSLVTHMIFGLATVWAYMAQANGIAQRQP